MKQLTARHPMTGMTIVQRWVDGARFLKVTPTQFINIYYAQLKKQFEGRPVEIELNKTGWIKIKKTGKDEQLEQAAKEIIEKEGKSEEDVDEDYILEKEAEMLKNQGFMVRLEEIG